VTPELESVQRAWAEAWEPALEAWSRFTQLTPPRWCRTEAEEKREGLSSSFAMIRLSDHAVIIGLPRVVGAGVAAFPREVLAHEVGHHVYAPGDLRDNARLMARVRRGLPTREGYAGLVANLYTDLLINDRLQRSVGLDMAGVYRALKGKEPDRLWTLYLRICETLWSLPAGTLVDGPDDRRLRGDAGLGARVVRAYAKDWLAGAGRFACLLLPYLLEQETPPTGGVVWLDAATCGSGDEIPDGLAEIEDDEEDAVHPAEDPALSGVDGGLGEESGEETGGGPRGGAPAARGGMKSRYREPTGYVDLMRSVGVKVTTKELVVRYYRERALPHLVPFPERVRREAADPLPEGLDTWDVGSPLETVDWTGTLGRSPVVIPGVTTVERVYGTTEGGDPQRTPLDLYVGIDCSGSMANPAFTLSYPVLAGTVLVLSALRAGARVMACLSGEPGRHAETKGFTRDERAVLGVMTDYLGTGSAFGIDRLKDTFVACPPRERPTHILVVSDSDFFWMLKTVKTGWDTAAEAPKRAGGGATAVLQLRLGAYADDVARLTSLGWGVHVVDSMEEVVAFAQAFARAKYGGPEERGP
jgi:hypothetical protein